MAKPKAGQIWEMNVVPYPGTNLPQGSGYTDTFICLERDKYYIKMKNVQTGVEEEFIEGTNQRWIERANIKNTYMALWKHIG